MKRVVKASLLANLALLAAGGAWAQSSVTVYGTADAYISNVRVGSTSKTGMSDGGNAASRIGFRGVEDLGGGQKVGFVLESGVLLQNGQGTLPGPGMNFARQAYVYLSGSWGKMELGRMYTPMFLTLLRTDPFGMNANFSPLNATGMTDAQTGIRAYASRTNNMFRYHLPDGLPVSASFAYAPGDTTVNTVKQGKFYGGNVGWTHGGLFVGYAIHRVHDGAEGPIVNPLGKSTHQTLSAAYQWPSVRVNANYMRTSSNLAGVPTAQLFALGVSYNVSSNSKLMAEVLHRKVDGSPRKQNVLALGYDYSLSKRTAVYGRMLYVSNKANASAGLGGATVPANSGHNIRSIGFGVRHNF